MNQGSYTGTIGVAWEKSGAITGTLAPEVAP